MGATPILPLHVITVWEDVVLVDPHTGVRSDTFACWVGTWGQVTTASDMLYHPSTHFELTVSDHV